MPTAHFPTPKWRKSSRTHQQGECVEVADFTTAIAVRDSKDPLGPVLRVDRDAFATLATRIRAGAYDL